MSEQENNDVVEIDVPLNDVLEGEIVVSNVFEPSLYQEEDRDLVAEMAKLGSEEIFVINVALSDDAVDGFNETVELEFDEELRFDTLRLMRDEEITLEEVIVRALNRMMEEEGLPAEVESTE